MSERKSDHRESPESVWLRANWNEERLGAYDRMWIAVKQLPDSTVDVIGAHAFQDELIASTADRNPLYAYVLLGPLQ